MKVAVVLSTFNGAGFLPAFLESLKNQSCRIELLVWRDDGSTDYTPGLIRDHARHAPWSLIALEGQRLGAARSFLSAIPSAREADLVFFADQDDVWLKDKVAIAAERIGRIGDQTPCLYASRLQLVDEGLRPISLSPSPLFVSFQNAVVESVLTGCTLAMNASLVRLLSRAVPEHVAMHDWWAYLLASACGEILFDERAHIYYRQHAGNLVGMSATGSLRLLERARTFLQAPTGQRSAQLAEFDAIYGDLLTTEQRRFIASLTQRSLIPRIRASMFSPIVRQSQADTLFTRLSLALGRF